MASAGQIDVGRSDTGTKVYDNALDGEATVIHVECFPTSDHEMEVRVEPLHKPGEWFFLGKGASVPFASRTEGGVSAVYARSADATLVNNAQGNCGIIRV